MSVFLFHCFIFHTHADPFIFIQYKGWDPDKAVQDYYTRIKGHEEYYETIDDQTWPYIKIVNVCRNLHASYLIEAD